MEHLNTISSQIWLNLGLIAVLFAVLKVRMRVTPRTSLIIHAPPAQVFDAIDIVDGKTNDLGRSRVTYALIDAAKQLYRFTYTTIVVGGRERQFEAQFRVAERIPGKLLRLERAGLEGKSQNNELLEIRQEISPENAGSRFTTQYYWGPRPILAQLLARTDLWGGVQRLKGFIETGVPNERAYSLMTALIGIVTGLITLATFWWAFGFELGLAVSAIVVLIIHEFGHLLAFRMIGQPWGRMMFLPFLGAIAMPRLPFETHAEAVFSALMGPGFSIFLCVACALYVIFGGELNHTVVMLGWIAVAINLFNIMPIEPLDGGIALRPVFTSIIGDRAHWGFIGCGALMVALGLLFGQFIVVAFGVIAMIANIKKRPVPSTLTPLTSRQLTLSICGYALLTSAYVSLWTFFSEAYAIVAATAT